MMVSLRSLSVWLVVCFALTAATNRSVATAAEESGNSRPNILFLFADDQAFHTIHALGNDEIRTPHLDRLTERGVTFTHAYNMGGWNGAICIASRTMLNSGRYLWQAHAIDRQAEQERRQGRFWSELMKTAGYETYFSGKWHVKADANKAFDHARHIRGGMPKQTPEGYNRPLSPNDQTWTAWDKSFGGFWEGGKHWSEVLAADGVDYLRQAAQSEKPFFMYLAFNAPHDPRQSPKSFVEMYPLKDVRVPNSFLPEYPYNEPMGSGRKLRDEKLAPFPRTKYAVQANRQEYYAIITHMDQQIGRILDALEESGQAENTYIVFSADHGLSVGHHGLLGKQNMYDHSVRVPLMVVGPDLPRGQFRGGDVYLQDIMATTLDWAGIDRPDHVQFRSLLPIIEGQRERNYEAIYGAYVNSQRMIRAGGYKLILYPNAKVARLFDLENDPDEMNDLAGEPGQQKRIKRLFARLLKLQTEMADELDLVASFPELVKQ